MQVVSLLFLFFSSSSLLFSHTLSFRHVKAAPAAAATTASITYLQSSSTPTIPVGSSTAAPAPIRTSKFVAKARKTQTQLNVSKVPVPRVDVPYPRGGVVRTLKLINELNPRTSSDEEVVRAVWATVQYEAGYMSNCDIESNDELDIRSTMLMVNIIRSHKTLNEAVISHVAHQLSTDLFSAVQIRNLFIQVIEKNPSVASAWAFDILMTALDQSSPNTATVVMYNKGFHAMVTYRIAHSLWKDGRKSLATFFQSLCSRKFGADIHPGAKISRGTVIHPGASIVIGETVTVGMNCRIGHGVTLGGTGKDSGDRHPKVGNGVYLRSESTLIGNIRIGDGAEIQHNAVVTKPVATFTRVGGVPAKFICNLPRRDVFSFEKDPHRYGEMGISAAEMDNDDENCDEDEYDDDDDDDDDDEYDVIFDNSDKEAE